MGIAMETDSLELDNLEANERILSPAQRSMRCLATLFCCVVLAASAFFASHMDARVIRGESGVSAVQPEIKSPPRETRGKDHGKLLAVLTLDSGKLAP
jgi:hypothetical protein